MFHYRHLPCSALSSPLSLSLSPFTNKISLSNRTPPYIPKQRIRKRNRIRVQCHICDASSIKPKIDWLRFNRLVSIHSNWLKLAPYIRDLIIAYKGRHAQLLKKLLENLGEHAKKIENLKFKEKITVISKRRSQKSIKKFQMNTKREQYHPQNIFKINLIKQDQSDLIQISQEKKISNIPIGPKSHRTYLNDHQICEVQQQKSRNYIDTERADKESGHQIDFEELDHEQYMEKCYEELEKFVESADELQRQIEGKVLATNLEEDLQSAVSMLQMLEKSKEAVSEQIKRLEKVEKSLLGDRLKLIQDRRQSGDIHNLGNHQRIALTNPQSRNGHREQAESQTNHVVNNLSNINIQSRETNIQQREVKKEKRGSAKKNKGRKIPSDNQDQQQFHMKSEERKFKIKSSIQIHKVKRFDLKNQYLESSNNLNEIFKSFVPMIQEIKKNSQTRSRLSSSRKSSKLTLKTHKSHRSRDSVTICMSPELLPILELTTEVDGPSALIPQTIISPLDSSNNEFLNSNLPQEISKKQENLRKIKIPRLWDRDLGTDMGMNMNESCEQQQRRNKLESTSFKGWDSSMLPNSCGNQDNNKLEKYKLRRRRDLTLNFPSIKQSRGSRRPSSGTLISDSIKEEDNPFKPESTLVTKVPLLRIRYPHSCSGSLLSIQIDQAQKITLSSFAADLTAFRTGLTATQVSYSPKLEFQDIYRSIPEVDLRIRSIISQATYIQHGTFSKTTNKISEIDFMKFFMRRWKEAYLQQKSMLQCQLSQI